MAHQNEVIDFSGLFKLDVIVHIEISTYSFYEVGLKKFLAVSSDKELVFLYIDSQSERFEKNYDWDFVDNPIYSLCFEPTGTWLLIVSEEKILLVPFLPLFIPQNTFDCKWSLSSVTVLPLLGNISKPTSVAWWLNKESENIIIIGCKHGTISFYSLESQTIVAESKVSDEVTDLQISFDDSLDLLTLLITGAKSQQWKLVLEHRSFNYNWLQQSQAAQNDRKDGFMSYIKQFSKEITMFTQGSSKEATKSQTIEYVLKPTEYLPLFRKGSNNWTLTSQYLNGRHFLTALEVNEGTLILESPDQDMPSRTLRPVIKKDGSYIQGLWSQRLIYLLRNNELEVHSSAFSVIQGDSLLGAKERTQLWNAELLGSVKRAFLVSTRSPPAAAGGWREPTFMCDLQLPRFNVEQCLVITTAGAFMLNTVCEPSEWLVGMIMRGGAGAEQSAAALSAPVPQLLRAAADMLLSRGKLAPAHYLYSLSQCDQDGWVARLGVFGRLQELSLFRPTGEGGGGGGATGGGGDGRLTGRAALVRLLAMLLKVASNAEEKFDMEVTFTNLTPVELEELCSVAVAIGLWDLAPMFSTHRGCPQLLLTAIKSRGNICRGAVDCLVRQPNLVPILLEENGQWLFDFIARKCNELDTKILKCLCLWLCPFQDQLRPVMRDLKQGITTVYTTRLLQLISTFMRVACAIESRDPSPEINPLLPEPTEAFHYKLPAQRALSCGLAHWAVSDAGSARVLNASTPVNTDLVGQVVSVACGRHHTLVLTQNGVYSAGDNSYGQLGVGACWAGALGDVGHASGTLTHVRYTWDKPVQAIAAGHYHSAAVDVAGRLFMWGWGVHGQLGLGTIDDEWLPRIVTKLQGRKVISVGCGSCHTVVLLMNGEVFAFGASVFGQLASGAREKSSVPVRVPLAEPAQAIAVGYFHNLALTTKGQLLIWGSSPQGVRAAHARRTSSPHAAPQEPHEPHLTPQPVDTSNVRGRIVQMSAGWHHSCIISNYGTLYAWGLNFDGQLGSGDRKLIPTPTEIKINRDSPVDAKNENQESKYSAKSLSTDMEVEPETRALVACGGDFTIYIDDAGRIFATGNTHQQITKDTGKTSNRVIMMKTTKRVIKIPANRTSNKFLYQPIDRIDIMFPFDIDNFERKPIEDSNNPLKNLADFKRKTWPDEIIVRLKSWINENDLAENLNMTAKLAYHNKMYPECLSLLLGNLRHARQEEKLYLTHTECDSEERASSLRKDDLKIAINNIMSKRIKEISLAILNEQPFSPIEPETIKMLPCSCDELKYLFKGVIPTTIDDISETYLSVQAAKIIDRCISIFPVDTILWETCFRLAKDYYIESNLSMTELEVVLQKFMEMDANTMAAAILYSDDCLQYSKILSPKFYLNMCGDIMESWS